MQTPNGSSQGGQSLRLWKVAVCKLPKKVGAPTDWFKRATL